MNNKPLISIITPSYNNSRYLSNTIESVKNQTYTNWEMIIVDDCSTDNSIEIIYDYSKNDNRIKLKRLSNNVGAAIARTCAMELAKGDFIAFLDSDDLWFPKKLEKQLSYMLDNNHKFTCTKYKEISENGADTGTVIKVKAKADYKQVLKTCPIGNSTVMYNARALGKFSVPDIKKNNDFALWLRILQKESYIFGLNEVLSAYRICSNSISSNKLKMIKYHWLLFRQHEKLPALYSFYLMFNWFFIKILKLKQE